MDWRDCYRTDFSLGRWAYGTRGATFHAGELLQRPVDITPDSSNT
jgi:hypothetical protein